MSTVTVKTLETFDFLSCTSYKHTQTRDLYTGTSASHALLSGLYFILSSEPEKQRYTPLPGFAPYTQGKVVTE